MKDDFLSMVRSQDYYIAQCKMHGWRNISTTNTSSNAHNTRETRKEKTREEVFNVINISLKTVQDLNGKIELADSDMLKSSLRQEKNSICRKMDLYLTHRINESNIPTDREDYMDYKMQFFKGQEHDLDLVEKNYGDFKPENYLNNKMLLEIKNSYEGLKEIINKALSDINLDQESIDKIWQSVRINYEKHLKKCESHEELVKHMQGRILSCGNWSGANPTSFIDAKRIEEQLNLKHIKAIDDLRFNSNQLVKQFVAIGLQISGQLPEESSVILEIKSAYENLEKKINENLANRNINDEIKLQLWQSNHYRSKYDQLLNKLKAHEQIIKKFQDKILNCDNLHEANTLDTNLKKTHQETMDQLNFHSNQLVKLFVTQGLQRSGQPLEESPMMSDIKNILEGFREKINKNLTDNNINEKIKSDVCKLFRSKCDQHLEKLKLAEKSVKQYEAQLLTCSNFQQAKNIDNYLKGIQKDIDKWKLGANDLIEEIINKAIEFSYQMPQVANPIDNDQPNADLIPHQQNDLPVQELSEEGQVINLAQAQPELLQATQQPLAQVQPQPDVMTPEQMMVLIQQLQDANAAKDIRIQELEQQAPVDNHPVDPDKWILRTEVEQIIDEYKKTAQTVETREKEKDLVIAAQNQENAGLRNELHHIDDKLKTALAHNQELREDKAELRIEKNEWKDKAVTEKEITQKLAHDLTTKDNEIKVLKQQLVTFQHPVDDLDDILSGWENLNQESSSISTIGDV